MSIESAQAQDVRHVFLDTTIIVERFFGTDRNRLNAISTWIPDGTYTMLCEFSRLEYKRVVMQNMSLALRYLCEEGLMSRALIRANSIPRHSRKAQTLISILAWVQNQLGQARIQIELDQNADEILASRAISYLRNALRSAWRRFSKSADSIVNKINCRRALEVPVERPDHSYDLTVHQAACRNKECSNANFFREQGSMMMALKRSLEGTPEKFMTAELKTALKTIELALGSPHKLYDYNTCLGLSDVWVHLECAVAGMKNLLTTNYKESQVLCPALGVRMLNANEPKP